MPSTRVPLSQTRPWRARRAWNAEHQQYSYPAGPEALAEHLSELNAVERELRAALGERRQDTLRVEKACAAAARLLSELRPEARAAQAEAIEEHPGMGVQTLNALVRKRDRDARHKRDAATWAAIDDAFERTEE